MARLFMVRRRSRFDLVRGFAGQDRLLLASRLIVEVGECQLEWRSRRGLTMPALGPARAHPPGRRRRASPALAPAAAAEAVVPSADHDHEQTDELGSEVARRRVPGPC
jgi:hypothetical protein